MQNLAQSYEELGSLFNSVVLPEVEKTNVDKIPNSIYHFTDYAGLAGILKTKTLWLSDIFSMNDTSEMSYGFELVDKAIRHMRPQEGV